MRLTVKETKARTSTLHFKKQFCRIDTPVSRITYRVSCIILNFIGRSPCPEWQSRYQRRLPTSPEEEVELLEAFSTGGGLDSQSAEGSSGVDKYLGQGGPRRAQSNEGAVRESLFFKF